MRKHLLLAGAVMLLAQGVALAEAPQSIRHRIVNLIAARVAESTPYRLQVGGVSGNFFTDVTLLDLRVRGVGMKEDLLRAESLRLGLDWGALLHGRVEIRTFLIQKPSIRFVLDAQHHLVLPASKSAPAGGQPFVLKIQDFKMADGRITVVQEDPDGARQVTFYPVSAAASVTLPEILVTSLNLGLKGGQLIVSGRASVGPTLSTDLSVRTIRWPFEELLKLRLSPPKTLHLTHSGQLQVQLAEGRLNVKSRGTLEGSPLTLDAQMPAGKPSRFHLELRPLSASRVWRDPGMVAAGMLSAKFDGVVYDPEEGDIDIKGELGISRRTGPTEPRQTAVATLALAHGRGPIGVTALADGFQGLATAQLNLRAQSVEGQFTLALSSFTGLSEWFPAASEMQGQASAYGSFHGPMKDLTVKLAAHAQDFSASGRSIEEVSATAEGHIGRREPLQAVFKVKNLVLKEGVEGPWDIGKMTLEVGGKLPLWDLQLEATFRNEVVLNYAGSAGILPGGWQANWKTLALSPPHGSALKTDQPGSLRARSGGMDLSNLKLSDGSGEIAVEEARWHSDAISLDLVVKALSFGPWLNALAPGRKGDGRLDAKLHLTGSPRRPEGTADLDLSTGTLQGWHFRDAGVRLRVVQPWLLVEDLRLIPISAGHEMHGGGKIPWHLIDADAPDLPLEITLKAPSIDPGILTAVNPGVLVDKGGNAGLIVTIDGHYPEVNVKGALSAHFPHLQVKPVGLDLHDVAVELRSAGRTLDIQQFSAKSKKGDLTLGGQMVLPELHVTVNAHNLDINIPKLFQAKLNAALLISGDLEGPDLSGEVGFKEATYTKPVDKKKKEGAPEEPVDDENDSPVWEGTTLDVHAAWARGAWYRDGLTKIETSGDLRVQKDEGATTPYMTGRISIMRGSYDAYGRDFLMDSGDIVFLGPPDINPTLNLRAKYSSGGTDVYLDVKGTAREPLLTLSSNPPLPEQDIISVLVIGKPLNQVGPTQGGTGATQNAQAAAVAGNIIGGYITRELRQSGMDLLGLDVVRVEPTTQGSRLMVGRYIGEKLFVSYGQPIQPTAGQVFDADYYLSKRWTISAQTGSGASGDTHMDLEFRYPLNGDDRRGSTAPMGASVSGKP